MEMDFTDGGQWPLEEGDLTDDSFANGSSGIVPQLLMPVWAYQSAAVYLIFISIMGLITNAIVVVVILNDRQKMTPLNWMLLNLACSDGTIAGFGTTVSTAAALQFGWPFGHEFCVAYAMIMSTAGIGSITTLTALALWRCQLVVYCPAKRGSGFANNNNNNNGAQLGHCRAALLLAIIWTYSLAVTCPPLFGWGRYDREAAHISCSVNWESKMDNNRSYIFYMFALGLFVPLIVIVASYVSILRVVKKTGKFRNTALATLKQTQQNDQQITADLQEVKQQLNDNNNQRNKSTKSSNSNAAEKRVTVMVACMIGAFMTAWTPYSILALFETFIGGPSNSYNNVSSFQDDGNENVVYFVSGISPGFATIPSLFAKTSAVLNPLIYGLLNTQFRSAWEKFSFRFLSRRRRRREYSQEMMGVSMNATSRRLRQLLDFSYTMRPSLTVNLPMAEIVPILNNESHPEPQYRSTSFRIVGTQPTTQILPQRQSAIKQDRRTETRSRSNSLDDRPVTNESSKCIARNPIQHEQPVKLVVVRLLSDSTSCCYTTDETSLDASSCPAGHSPYKNRFNKSKNNQPQQV
ncbi:rhodopsin-like [Daphnia carinata]|uniref:rhodopsin-like n=1 Tax=Daphnia carinata TaxID=120202 RepID=UPI00257AA6A3|nr:rhodopsin-like [Daphnia carinata]